MQRSARRRRATRSGSASARRKKRRRRRGSARRSSRRSCCWSRLRTTRRCGSCSGSPRSTPPKASQCPATRSTWRTSSPRTNTGTRTCAALQAHSCISLFLAPAACSWLIVSCSVHYIIFISDIFEPRPMDTSVFNTF